MKTACKSRTHFIHRELSYLSQKSTTVQAFEWGNYQQNWAIETD